MDSGPNKQSNQRVYSWHEVKLAELNKKVKPE